MSPGATVIFALNAFGFLADGATGGATTLYWAGSKFTHRCLKPNACFHGDDGKLSFRAVRPPPPPPSAPAPPSAPPGHDHHLHHLHHPHPLHHPRHRHRRHLRLLLQVRPIAAGDVLTISYLGPWAHCAIPLRRATLLATKGFACRHAGLRLELRTARAGPRLLSPARAARPPAGTGRSLTRPGLVPAQLRRLLGR